MRLAILIILTVLTISSHSRPQFPITDIDFSSSNITAKQKNFMDYDIHGIKLGSSYQQHCEQLKQHFSIESNVFKALNLKKKPGMTIQQTVDLDLDYWECNIRLEAYKHGEQFKQVKIQMAARDNSEPSTITQMYIIASGTIGSGKENKCHSVASKNLAKHTKALGKPGGYNQPNKIGGIFGVAGLPTKKPKTHYWLTKEKDRMFMMQTCNFDAKKGVWLFHYDTSLYASSAMPFSQANGEEEESAF